jgi:hypothetical protein
VLEMNPEWTQEIAGPKETLKDYGRRVCGSDSQVATGVSDEITHILTRLRALKGYWTIEANQCHRLGCGDDSGVYWCNVSGGPLFPNSSRVGLTNADFHPRRRTTGQSAHQL